MDRSLVLAIDGSKNSNRALGWCLENFFKKTDQVHLVTVTQPVHCPLAISPLGAEPVVVMNYQEFQLSQKRSTEQSEELLQTAKAALTDAGIPCKMHVRHNSGNPGADICQISDTLHADCIIMGSRGLGTVRRTFIGSTSDYVLHHSSCPVLIIKKERKH